MLKEGVPTLNIKWSVKGEGFYPIQIDAEKRR